MDSVCVFMHVAQTSVTEPSQHFLLPNICIGIDHRPPQRGLYFVSASHYCPVVSHLQSASLLYLSKQACGDPRTVITSKLKFIYFNPAAHKTVQNIIS